MSGGELHAALEGLRRRGWTGGAAFRGLVVTGTGFYGPERAAIRELSHLCGLSYSGDLVNGLTTHLVLAAAGGAAPGAGRKAGKAADWGIPTVRLAWLLDSIAAQRPQQVDPYLLAHQAKGPAGEQQHQQHAAAGQQAAAAGSCQQLPLRHRPSSVASNAPPDAATAARSVPAEQQHGAGCSPGVLDRQQQVQQQQDQQQRAALAPVGNLLADQLRRMSISPEPLPQQHSAAAQLQQQQQQQWLPNSPPADSPQRSLSMRSMVGAALPAAAPGSAGSLAEVTSAAAQPAAAAEAPAGFSPMQQSPAASQQQQEQQQGAGSPGEGYNPPFTFSLATALGRSLLEEAAGSPMADSPASTAAGGSAARPPGRLAAVLGRSLSEEPGGGSPMVESPASTVAGVSAARPPSRLGVTPLSAQMGSKQGGQCTLPTPACIRNWSDDDDASCGGSSAAGRPAAGARMATAIGAYHVHRAGMYCSLRVAVACCACIEFRNNAASLLTSCSLQAPSQQQRSSPRLRRCCARLWQLPPSPRTSCRHPGSRCSSSSHSSRISSHRPPSNSCNRGSSSPSLALKQKPRSAPLLLYATGQMTRQWHQSHPQKQQSWQSLILRVRIMSWQRRHVSMWCSRSNIRSSSTASPCPRSQWVSSSSSSSAGGCCWSADPQPCCSRSVPRLLRQLLQPGSAALRGEWQMRRHRRRQRLVMQMSQCPALAATGSQAAPAAQQQMLSRRQQAAHLASSLLALVAAAMCPPSFQHQQHRSSSSNSGSRGL
jgi:hypothetical protein